MSAPESERIRIELQEVERAVLPLPVRASLPLAAPSRGDPRRVDPLASGALALSLLGVPLAGCLLGPVAIFCGAVALSRLRGREGTRGFGLALAGLLVGVVELIAWTGGLGWALFMPSKVPRLAAPPVMLTSGALEVMSAPSHIRQALLANVRLTCEGPEGLLGSGVNVASRDGRTLLLTNRHVAECPQGAMPRVLFHDGEQVAGRVLWSGPVGLDLVVVEAHSGQSRVGEVMPLSARADARVGDDVFAVGNPLGFDGTYTTGVLSAVRRLPMGAIEGRVFQVQVAVNPGNSGGGLYSMDGVFLGINTWAMDRNHSEGLGFAISADTIAQALRDADAPIRELVRASSEEERSLP
ncbi:trypsin-like peptidase domain-containing protein [Myxococcus sp. K38C18041901]|uniref:trypsin-like peptidase domain-containing protein n=1 Tax=Myxococcus guangdongensis TaxID=2906760 RepID=UPI0020A7368B|nr:trypsin-like peptidase domain-containing protein [Myxococcus guangdongensis]MCP3065058.1 trypsin-like peptidase domain-containing protein [Myxococcus guangdongensis]